MNTTFQEVACALRQLLKNTSPVVQDLDGIVKHNNVSLVVRKALVSAESEMAAQAVEYLYHHLVHFEQFREAAHLLAFSMPHACRSDPRVVRCMQEASSLADKMDTPEAEILNSGYSKGIHSIKDIYITDLNTVVKRCMYFIQICKISRAKTATEFGTGSGSNIMQAAQLHPDISWIGIDISRDQILSNEDQAGRLGITSSWATHPDVSFYGKSDVVGVLDCLEHTVYPDQMLDAAEGYLKPGGLTVISVPNGPWSLHTDNEINAYSRPGNHVAVGSPEKMIEYLNGRGSILDCRILDNSGYAEGNSSLCITYEPRQ